MNEYSIKDFKGKSFYNKIISDIENNFRELIQLELKYAKDIEVNKEPVELFCPIENKRIDFPFPFAKEIKKLFYFIKGQYDYIPEITGIINELKEDSQVNIVSKYFVQQGTNRGLLNSRIGFLITLAETRIKLYRGRDLSANELAMLIGVTNQGIVNKISRGKLQAKKVGVRYHIENEDAWAIISERDDYDLIDDGVPYYSYGKAALLLCRGR